MIKNLSFRLFCKWKDEEKGGKIDSSVERKVETSYGK